MEKCHTLHEVKLMAFLLIQTVARRVSLYFCSGCVQWTCVCVCGEYEKAMGQWEYIRKFVSQTTVYMPMLVLEVFRLTSTSAWECTQLLIIVWGSEWVRMSGSARERDQVELTACHPPTSQPLWVLAFKMCATSQKMQFKYTFSAISIDLVGYFWINIFTTFRQNNKLPFGLSPQPSQHGKCSTWNCIRQFCQSAIASGNWFPAGIFHNIIFHIEWV